MEKLCVLKRINLRRKYYLAYGSDLNISRMRELCPGAKPVGTAVLDGYRLLFKGRDGGFFLTIEPAEGFSVPVVIWEIREKDECFLDFCEEHSAMYSKAVFSLLYRNRKSGTPHFLSAFTYVMDDGCVIGIPDMHYFTTCAQGYEAFNFDISTLTEAYEYCVQKSQEAKKAERRDS